MHLVFSHMFTKHCKLTGLSRFHLAGPYHAICQPLVYSFSLCIVFLLFPVCFWSLLGTVAHDLDFLLEMAQKI